MLSLPTFPSISESKAINLVNCLELDVLYMYFINVTTVLNRNRKHSSKTSSNWPQSSCHWNQPSIFWPLDLKKKTIIRGFNKYMSFIVEAKKTIKTLFSAIANKCMLLKELCDKVLLILKHNVLLLQVNYSFFKFSLFHSHILKLGPAFPY